MQLNDSRDDVHAKARAAIGAGTGLIHAVKRFGDLGDILLCHTAALILHDEGNIGVAVSADSNNTAWLGSPCRVFHKVDQQGKQEGFVCVNGFEP